MQVSNPLISPQSCPTGGYFMKGQKGMWVIEAAKNAFCQKVFISIMLYI